MGAILDFFLNEKKGGTEGEEPKNKPDTKETDPDMKEGEDTNADDFGGIDQDGDGDIDDDDLFHDVDNEADKDTNNNDQNDQSNDNKDNDDNQNDDMNTDDDGFDDSDNIDGEEDNTNSDTEDDSSVDDSQTEDNLDELVKKNLLKKSFSNLYSDIRVIIDKVNSSIDYDDEVESFTLSNLSNNLKRSQSLVYDYVLNIFDKKEYAENLYIYYSILDTVKLSKEIISKIVEKRNKD